MSESSRVIFVDFNRRGREPGTYVTWGSQFDSPITLGAPVHLTDHDEMESDGYIVAVSADLREVVVRVGQPPSWSPEPLGNLALRDFDMSRPGRLAPELIGAS